MNNNVSVCGVAWGDEGKAKVINYLASQYDWVIRWGGSENAGHTLYYKGQKIVRNYIPSADFSIPSQKAFLASGMVINPYTLLEEIKRNQNIFPNLGHQIYIDPNAFLITEDHLNEDKENVKTIGSTGKGVTPAYKSKIGRTGTKLQKLIDDNAPIITALKNEGVQFKYMLELYNDFSNSKLIFEGAQSLLLDLNFGSYPNVTSGNCSLGGICDSGFSTLLPNKIYGVVKAYSTRVGNGPFPTELFGEEAERLRAAGNEYGVVTKRPRRVGYLDLPALKYACIMGGITDLVITKFDILNGMNQVSICTKYEKSMICGENLYNAVPYYTKIEGWQDAKQLNQLQPFIDLVQNNIGLPVSYISNGPNSEDMIKL